MGQAVTVVLAYDDLRGYNSTDYIDLNYKKTVGEETISQLQIPTGTCHTR